MSAATDADLMHDDLRDLLDALGMFSGARPESPHEVMREVIRTTATLRAQVATLRARLHAIEALRPVGHAMLCGAPRGRCFRPSCSCHCHAYPGGLISTEALATIKDAAESAAWSRL